MASGWKGFFSITGALEKLAPGQRQETHREAGDCADLLEGSPKSWYVGDSLLSDSASAHRGFSKSREGQGISTAQVRAAEKWSEKKEDTSAPCSLCPGLQTTLYLRQKAELTLICIKMNGFVCKSGKNSSSTYRTGAKELTFGNLSSVPGRCWKSSRS